MSADKKKFSRDSFDLQSIISTYTRHWKWFVLCLVVALVIAFLKLRYSVPLYNSTARIQIIEDKTSSSELSAFQDLEVLSGSKNKVEDEIETIVSRSNFIQVVKSLNLNLKIETIGKVINSEVYKESYPFILKFKDKDSVLFRQKGDFYINIVSKDKIGLKTKILEVN